VRCGGAVNRVMDSGWVVPGRRTVLYRVDCE
jgi:hypothetical protein